MLADIYFLSVHDPGILRSSLVAFCCGLNSIEAKMPAVLRRILALATDPSRAAKSQAFYLSSEHPTSFSAGGLSRTSTLLCDELEMRTGAVILACCDEAVFLRHDVVALVNCVRAGIMMASSEDFPFRTCRQISETMGTKESGAAGHHGHRSSITSRIMVSPGDRMQLHACRLSYRT